jgi:hypothetical protein
MDKRVSLFGLFVPNELKTFNNIDYWTLTLSLAPWTISNLWSNLLMTWVSVVQIILVSNIGTARLKNVNNCLNTNIYSYLLEASGGRSSNLYLIVVNFFNTSVN